MISYPCFKSAAVELSCRSMLVQGLPPQLQVEPCSLSEPSRLSPDRTHIHRRRFDATLASTRLWFPRRVRGVPFSTGATPVLAPPIYMQGDRDLMNPVWSATIEATPATPPAGTHEAGIDSQDRLQTGHRQIAECERGVAFASKDWRRLHIQC